MLVTKRLGIRNGLLPEDMRAVLLSLERRGWTPTILHSDSLILADSGLDSAFAPRSLAHISMPSDDPDPFFSGDVFFKGGDTYFVATTEYPDKATSHSHREEIRIDIGSVPSAGRIPFLEVGVISTSGTGLDEKASALAKDVEASALAAVDGRKTRHMKFEWTPIPGEYRRLRRFLQPEAVKEEPWDDETSEVVGPAEPPEVRFEPLHLDSAMVAGARVLGQSLARGVLRQISQARFAVLQELTAAQGGDAQAIASTANVLKAVGLIKTQYILTCRKTSLALTRVEELGVLGDPKVGKLVCHHCGRTFDQEAFVEGYSSTSLGQALNNRSHWLTVWTTQLLVDLGVSPGAILWNVAEGGEEVDIVAEHLEELWIFELKDREFGRGDAHPFVYRSSRYKPQHAVVLTTEVVSTEAKRVFREIVEEEGRPRPFLSRGWRPREPLYVEGLDAAASTLNREFTEASIDYAAKNLDAFATTTGLNFRGLLLAMAESKGVG